MTPSNYFLLSLLSSILILLSYCAAYFVWRNKVWSEKTKQKTGCIIGSIFAISLVIFIDTLLQQIRGISFLTLLLQGSNIPLIVYGGGCLIGIVYEYVGQFSLRRWYYPAIQRKRLLLFALPFYWGFFMLIVQDVWTIFRTLGFTISLSTLFAAIFIFFLIEGINICTRSWVYVGWGKSILVLIPGWVILILTFVVGFNFLIINPFSA